VTVEGILDELFVRPGQQVAAGQPLAQLRNLEVEFDIIELIGQRDMLKERIKGVQRVRQGDPRTATPIEPELKSLDRVNKMLAERELDRDRLLLAAPRAGTVLPPPQMPARAEDEASLPTWSGSPMDPENLGATLLADTKFCEIGDPHRLEARLIIDQSDIGLLGDKTGQRVELLLAQSAGRVYIGHIEKVAPETVSESPVHLSSLNGGQLPTQMSPSGVAEPISPVFDAIVPFEEADPQGLLRVGLVGRAKISVDRRTIASRFWRYLRRTFNFDF
jgi:putative peptide zinc metalloprotease protein